MKIKVHVLILILLIILPTAIGCAQKSDETSETTLADIDNGSDTAEETVDEETLLYGSLPEEDYRQYVFNVLNLTSNFAITTFTTDSETGDVVNDAIFKRNLTVEERLNISINSEEMSYGNVYNTIVNLVNSGESSYDIVFNETWEMVSLATQGCLYETDDLTLDTDKPWWNSAANESLRVENYLYMMVGDLHLMFWESMWCIAFNKKMVSDLNLDDIYTLVKNGQWTYEKMVEMMNSVVADLDGDGVMGAGDRYGATTYKSGVYSALICGCNIKLLKLNDDGTPQSLIDDKVLTVCSNITKDFYTNSGVYNRGISTEVVSDFPVLFENGQALFEMEVIGGVKDLRTSSIDYGIIPYPKYDESQDDYVTLTAQYASAMGVPVTNSELDRTSAIVECLAAYSYKDLRPAYYDNLLSLKSVRDEESTEMLDIIFGNSTFELDLVLLNNSGYSSALSSVMYTGNTNFTSTLTTISKVVQKKLSLITDSFEKYAKR